MRALTRAVLIGAITVLCVASSTFAQTSDAVCKSILEQRSAPTATDNCFMLATFINTRAQQNVRAVEAILRPDAVPLGAVLSARDIQPSYPQQASLAGSAAQGHAVPSVQPAGIAAGSVAAVGTDGGQEALAALGINPALLFLSDRVTRELAQFSRFADLTVFLPVSRLSGEDDAEGGSGPDYVGVRLRLNVHGLKAGGEMWDRARTLLRNRIVRAGANVQSVLNLLSEADDLRGCAATLLDESEDEPAITAACGAPFVFAVNMAEAEELRSEFARIRNEADANYFGADIRYDSGDPTLGAVENAAGRSLFAGLSYGRRLVGDPSGPTYGFRARIGARHARLDSETETDWGVEGGLGFELVRRLDEEEINASAALEFRQGSASDELEEELQSDFIMLRGSLLLPVTAANSLSLNLGVPLSGTATPTLSVNFNWGLMFPDALRD